MEEIPEFVSATRFRNWGSFLIKRDNPDSENIKQDGVIWSDPNVFDVFDIPLVKGNDDKCLDDPNSVIISESAARKYFNDEDPINKSLILNNSKNVKVTGIFEDMPANSHFQFDVMISMKGLDESKSEMWISNNFHTYFLMANNSEPALVLDKINEMFESPIIKSGTISGFLPVSNSNRNNTSFFKKGQSTADNSINLQQ